MNVSEVIQELGDLKQLSSAKYQEYKALKDTEDNLKELLQAELDKSGLKSVKGKHYLAAKTSRTDIVVDHEPSVIEWLENTPDIEADAYIGLKLANFKQLATKVLKDTGEVIPGTETLTKDSITIRRNK